MRQRILYATLVLTIACSSEAPESNPEGNWVGTITTEGNVTTAVNESGSVWGGPARLVEEASIGVETGEPEYMFGYISGLYASDDEIYVLDQQARELRVFDWQGTYLRTLGGPGQGPGELARPCYVTGTPDGRIFVIARGNGRINVYGPDGDTLRPWQLAWLECQKPFKATPDGTLWTHTYVRSEDFRQAIQAVDEEGFVGDPWLVPELEYERWTFRFDGRDYEAVPYAPRIVWGLLPGAMAVGTTDRYRFEVRYPDGRRTVIERYWDPVPVSDMERDHRTAYLPLEWSRAPLDWDGRLPEHKPAFESFIPTYSGQIWVRREIEATPIEGCDPTAMTETALGLRPERCYEPAFVVDAFEADGRYLGEIEVPSGAAISYLSTSIRGDDVVALHFNDAGTIMVKRYRLILPGQEGH